MNDTKKYLLTVFGDYKDEKVCQEMAICITPLVDSPQLKFQYSRGTVLFHFASLFEQSEIYDFLDLALETYSNAFILTINSLSVVLFNPSENRFACTSRPATPMPCAPFTPAPFG
jgi:hypothetical protein